MGLNIGDFAPDFTSTDQNGATVKLSDFHGKKVILYFYPKDNTPSCTVQACSLRDGYTKLRRKGYIVLGVSGDSERAHTNFIKKFTLPFTLLADMDHTIINAYQVWQEKTTFGRTYMGIVRTTFIIDEVGKIERIINKVNTRWHAEQILTRTEE